ncbi:MAG TPA: chemotaxis protein CheW [Rhodopila sp.]|uniref:chemotaxis protein CheW n=1 Tax=Rhodopila sp. TaxID=2480087 RepID=UPI002CBCDFE3|nr:chemotaxis protein CheW [Rhodopila sp.]HVY13846.1 chemotaxis protein CheW [Rhodopila sp.]
MLFLVFRLDNDRYAIDARAIIEILPLVRLAHVPHAPAGVAGLLNLHGQPVPVIDLALLLLGRPYRPLMSTRILLVCLAPRPIDGQEIGLPARDRPLALIAENATDVMRRDPASFVDPGIRSENASFLGPVAQDREGPVRRIAVEGLLTPAIRSALYQDEAHP